MLPDVVASPLNSINTGCGCLISVYNRTRRVWGRHHDPRHSTNLTEESMAVQSACEVVVRRLRDQDQPLLEEMYNTFTPPATVLGLPPCHAAQRSSWLAKLRKGINLVAFVEDKLAGHLALVPIGDAA